MTTTRRLAAIVAADVVGYSKMMGADEAGTLASLKAHRAAVDPIVLNHGGRIVKTTGDGLLLEFPSVVGAVSASLEAQKLMASRNEELPDDRRMQLRLGIHMGDVIVDDEDLFGDGVNIAARLEPLAPPGGIAISDKAYAEAKRHVDCLFEEAGVHSLKNIEQPVKIWAWSERSGKPEASGYKGSGSRRTNTMAVVGVLPFENHSASKDDEYFSDGMTEDLINALSRQSVFRVLGRHSTFHFKGSKDDTRLIARELDATYLVRGSVRRAANRVRVTAELLAPETGEQLWSERYDRDLDDLFAIQDEVTAGLAACIAPEINRAETRIRARLTGAELSAWDCFLKGLSHYYAATSSDFERACIWFRKAIEHDSSLAAPKAWLAIVSVHRVQVDGAVRSTRELWSEAQRLAQDAVRLDSRSSLAFSAYAFVNAFSGNYDAAIEAGTRAVELNVHDGFALGTLGICHFFAGDHNRALQIFLSATQLNPNDQNVYHWAAFSAFCHFLLGNYEAALSWARKALYGNSEHLQALGVRAAALAKLGRAEEAATAAQEFMARAGGRTLAQHVKNFRWRNPADIAHYRDGLAKAGVQ